MSTWPDLADGVRVEDVADIAEMGGVEAVELVDERGAQATPRAVLRITEGAHAGDHDVVDLELARSVEDIGRLKAGRDRHAELSREDARSVSGHRVRTGSLSSG